MSNPPLALNEFCAALEYFNNPQSASRALRSRVRALDVQISFPNTCARINRCTRTSSTSAPSAPHSIRGFTAGDAE